MTILCTIDLLTREVFLPADQRIAAYDHNVDVIHFQAEPVEDFSFDLSSIRIAAKGPNKARHDYPVDPSTVQIEEETGYITFDWPIPQGVTEMPEDMFGYGSTGQLIFAVCAEIISGSALSKAWHSDDGIITVVAHLEPESGGGEDPSEEATNAQKIGQLQTDMAVVQRAVAAVAGGTPTVVDAKADMTDTNKIYVLSTDGKWYYHDGTTWTAGGTYGGAVTDPTLSINGAPADAKAVGDALADKADADDVDAIDDRVTAAEEDINNLKAKNGFTDTEIVLLKNILYAIEYSTAEKAATNKEYIDTLIASLSGEDVLPESISATYSGGGVALDTDIDTLKADLVVRVNYSDGTYHTLNSNEYTLSGNLHTSGISTITVSWQLLSTTFTVNVVSNLPSGYTPVSAIINKNNTAIDTGVTLASSNVKFEFSVARDDTSNMTLCGNKNGNGNGRFHIEFNGSNGVFVVRDVNASSSVTILRWSPGTNVKEDYIVEYNGQSGTATKDGTIVDTTDASANIYAFNKPIYVGTVGEFNGYGFKGKIYRFKISENDVLVRNFIPCLDANQTPCFYDLVTETTFYNSGSGTYSYVE